MARKQTLQSQIKETALELAGEMAQFDAMMKAQKARVIALIGDATKERREWNEVLEKKGVSANSRMGAYHNALFGDEVSGFPGWFQIIRERVALEYVKTFDADLPVYFDMALELWSKEARVLGVDPVTKKPLLTLKFADCFKAVLNTAIDAAGWSDSPAASGGDGW
jgi:hypothetical protein